MPRSTLPTDFDPLAELGIGRSAPSMRRPEVASKSKAKTPSVPVPAPNGSAHASSTRGEEPRQATPQSAVSQPTIDAELRDEQARVRPRLTLASSAPAAAAAPKAKASGRVSADIFEEVRDCVVWNGHAMTIDSFIEDAFREHLKRLRRQHSLGDRFPPREREPKQGRRVS